MTPELLAALNALIRSWRSAAALHESDARHRSGLLPGVATGHRSAATVYRNVADELAGVVGRHHRSSN